MALKIRIPMALRRFTEDREIVEVEAETVKGIIDRLEERYPGFRSRLCDTNGELRRFIKIYVDGEDVQFLDNLSTRVPNGAEVSIVPAIAGG